MEHNNRSLPLAPLHSLPEHVVGHLYSLLPDRDSRKAFYASSKSVCHAPSVLHQISKLTVTEDQLGDILKDPSSNPLLTYPRRAKLRQLFIEFDEFLDSSPLMAMLLPQSEDLRLRVQTLFRDVEVLQFHVHVLQAEDQHGIRYDAARRWGKLLREFAPSLHTLRLPTEIVPPIFFETMSAYEGGSKIHCMEIGEVKGQHFLKVLRRFKNLRSLELEPDVTMDGESLRQLKCTLSELRQLRHLCLNTWSDLKAGTVAALPASLESISFNLPFIRGDSGDCFDFLIELLSCASSAALPALKVITINECMMIIDIAAQEYTTEALSSGLARLARCLSASASPTLKVAVGCLQYDDWRDGASAIHPAFWSLCSVLGTYATTIGFQGAQIRASDITYLREQFPHIKGLDFVGICRFEDLPACLSIATEGLPSLEQLQLVYHPKFDPGDHASYLRGFGCDMLSVCASLNPNRECALEWIIHMLTPAHGSGQEACVNAAHGELRSMLKAWNRFCQRQEFKGANQQIEFDLAVNGMQL